MGSLNKPTISIIIPVYNGGESFRECLSSIAECKTSPEEIIVVADGDSDGSWRFAKEFNARVLRIPTPGGPARARNLGAQQAKGEILFFMDADVTIPKEALSLVIGTFEREPDLVALFGAYDDEPFESNFLSQYKNLFHHYVHQASKEDASSFWGACGAIRREIFQEIGGFNEDYHHPSIEDIELGYRLKRTGYRIRLLKNLNVKHLKHWGIISMLRADFFFRAIPWSRLIIDEGKFPDDLNVKISDRMNVIVAYFLLLFAMGSIFIHWLVIPVVLSIILLLILNRDLYIFFKRKRGTYFALKTIPWHWFYFFYSGLAFVTALSAYYIKRMRESRIKEK